MMRKSPALSTHSRLGNASSGKKSNMETIHSKGSHHGHKPQGKGSRPSFFGSTSKRNIAQGDASQKGGNQTKAVVQVIDEEGVDVTPRSILAESSSLRMHQSSVIMNAGDSSSIGTPSEFLSQSVFGASTMQASYAQGFSRSVMGSVIGSASKISLDSITDEIAEPSHLHDFSSGLGDIKTRRTAVKEDLSEEDLDKMVSITLEETETIWHLDIPGTVVANDTDLVVDVKERNEKYEQLLKNRAGNDMYIPKGVQTFNDALKHKDAQTLPVGKEDVGCLATTWDMYDTYNVDQNAKEDTGDTMESLSRPASPKQPEKIPDAAPTTTENSESMSRRKSSMMSTFSGSRASFLTTSRHSDMFDLLEKDSQKQIEVELQAEKILHSESMRNSLFTMERAVMQNIFHSRQALYRGLTPASIMEEELASTDDKAIDENLGPNLAKLWTYTSAVTRGMTVNCMCWNKMNQDLLAVGYGDLDGISGKHGLICCWSLKNPEQPEKMFTLDSAVTAVDFSTSHPNLLAAGLQNGAIAVFNVRNQVDTHVLDSFGNAGKHSGPIWQIKWIERDKGTGEEKGEVIVSSSADGRVTQWSIRKGFEYQDLIKLKRVNASKNSQAKQQKNDTGKKGDALISRFSTGFCFDFHSLDGTVYLAGTEEGYIHKCSCSYNEQFLETYAGHTGPVYKVIWNQTLPNAFLSCSSDWTIRLWNHERPQSVLTVQSTQQAINDMDWSPTAATVFAVITDSQIQVWDLSYSVLDPLLTQLPIQNTKLSSILFAKNSESILIGDCDGQVTVYQMRSMPPSTDQVEVLTKLLKGNKESQGTEGEEVEDTENDERQRRDEETVDR